jgi:hypothetical protein
MVRVPDAGRYLRQRRWKWLPRCGCRTARREADVDHIRGAFAEVLSVFSAAAGGKTPDGHWPLHSPIASQQGLIAVEDGVEATS